MKEVLALIEKRKQEYARLPFFKFLQDKSIEPRQRLLWAPCAAPFIMDLAELNKLAFREEPTEDPIQVLINNHTYEDDHHFYWFLEDCKKIGFDYSIQFTDALKFIWSEDISSTRWVSHNFFRYALEANPIQKLIIIEAFEAAGNVFFSNCSDIAQDIAALTGEEYRYFGDFHLAVETGHTIGLNGTEQFIENIHLTDIQRQEAFDLTEKIFELATILINGFLKYNQTHLYRQNFVNSSDTDVSITAV